ncbi:MAG: hypothetical protein KJ072_25610, partial [Verrucomicrobia bacterium]|nr:hypothetical protein [Verrucomicrobiota bacterium]
MNSQKALMTGFMVLVCFMSNAALGAEPQAILHVLPTEESLGQHWKREVIQSVISNAAYCDCHYVFR